MTASLVALLWLETVWSILGLSGCLPSCPLVVGIEGLAGLSERGVVLHGEVGCGGVVVVVVVVAAVVGVVVVLVVVCGDGLSHWPWISWASPTPWPGAPWRASSVLSAASAAPHTMGGVGLNPEPEIIYAPGFKVRGSLPPAGAPLPANAPW